MKKTWLLKVYGIVQGVCLRYNVEYKAKSLGLKGFIRNLPDGTVEIKVFGQESDLNKLIDWLKLNPGSANIQKISKSESLSKEMDAFHILY